MCIVLEKGKFNPEDTVKIHCSNCGCVRFSYTPYPLYCNRCDARYPVRYQLFYKYIGARVKYYENRGSTSKIE